MIRRVLVTCALVPLILFAASVELDACGDKFLRIGRSIRHKAYAAVHRASILVYVPADAKPRDVNAFESALKRAGHRPTSVRSPDAFAAALGSHKYDIIIASLADAPQVKAHAETGESRPEILPVVSERARGALAEIEREYAFTLKVDAPRFNALATIDDLMEARLARARSAAAATH